MLDKESSADEHSQPAEGSADSSNPEGDRSSPTPPEDDQPKVVYRRDETLANTGQGRQAMSAVRTALTQQLAPAIMPLIVGFLLLLILISVLGFLSVRRMDEVSVAVLDLEQQHAARLSLLLKLRLAVTKLNNEARARAEAEARRELKSPFHFRLDAASDEVNDLLAEVKRPPLVSDPMWHQFRNDLNSYVEVTKDLRRYSLEGFDKFSAVDTELNALLSRSSEEQTEIVRQSEMIEQNAVRSIRTWTIIALFVGALVAAGTIWEIQRRFGEMRRSMDEARRERGFTSQLLEGMVSAVAAIDENDRIRSANAAFFKIFPGASIGASIYEKFAPESSMKMLEAATVSRVDKATYRGRWVCSAGEDCPTDQVFDVYSSPLDIDGTHGQILTLVDVTEAAEAERDLRRQESLAAVGQATAQVAHEIRNPLGSIRLGVAMLRDNVSDQEGVRTIELVERGIHHLNKLVVDVAQFSRRKALERTKVDLHQLVNHSLDLVTDRINEKATPVEKKFSAEHLVGNWDPDQLNQVLVNILANAIDASPKNAPIVIVTEVVSVATGDDLAPKRHARVSVADQGDGIDPASLERIFEPFFSTKKRGTGLGLAIVKQIVELHGGHIGVESEPGKGTRFTIDLPL
jgi:nitrogen-specific signal transduction histidine kinase